MGLWQTPPSTRYTGAMSERDPTQHYYDHVFLGDAHDRNGRLTLIVVILNSLAMVAEIVWGWLTGSMALLADGVHMATDAGALAIAAAAYAYARAHASNARYTFGTGKVGDLAAFASAIILGLAAAGIAVEACLRLAHPASIRFGEAIWVAALGLAVNIVSALLLARGARPYGHEHGGHGHGHDNNLRAASLHLVADALTSALAIAALVGALYSGWLWLDSVAALIGAALIARWAALLLRDAGAVLLDSADPALLAEVRTAVEASGADIADLHVWRIGPHAYAAIVSAPGGDARAIRAALAPIPALAHVTVECG